MSTTAFPNGLNIADKIGGKPRFFTFDFPLASGFTTSIGSGDPVSILNGTIVQSTAPSSGPPTGSQIIAGVFQSVQYQPSQQLAPATFPYWVGGTTTFNGANALVSVSLDPMQVYIVQANGPVAQTAIGKTYELGGFASASAANGYRSAVYLDTSTGTAVGANFGQVKILGLAPATPATGPNAWSDAYTWVKVIFNNTIIKAGQYS